MEDVCDQLGPIPLVTLPKDRLGQKKKTLGVSLLRYFSLSALSALFGTAAEIYILGWDLLPLRRPA